MWTTPIPTHFLRSLRLSIFRIKEERFSNIILVPLSRLILFYHTISYVILRYSVRYKNLGWIDHYFYYKLGGDWGDTYKLNQDLNLSPLLIRRIGYIVGFLWLLLFGKHEIPQKGRLYDNWVGLFGQLSVVKLWYNDISFMLRDFRFTIRILGSWSLYLTLTEWGSGHIKGLRVSKPSVAET